MVIAVPARRQTAQSLATAVCCLLLGWSTAWGAKGDCGQPFSSGDNPSAADALYALKVAVGLLACKLSVCDVDGSNKITAGDALRILKVAVGQDVPLLCPAPTTTTSTSTTTTTLAQALTWTQIQAQFATSCAGAVCHTGSGNQSGLSGLDSANTGYTELVDANEECGSSAYVKRVLAGHPEQSFLMAKLDGTHDCGARMPFERPSLAVSFRDGVRAWIAAGAPKN